MALRVTMFRPFHFPGWENNQASEQTSAPSACGEWSRMSLLLALLAIMGSSRNASQGKALRDNPITAAKETIYSPPRRASPNISH